jgi:hypothetical protein
MTRDLTRTEREEKLGALAERLIEGERKAAFADAVAGKCVTSARYERHYKDRVNNLDQILAVEQGRVHPHDTHLYRYREPVILPGAPKRVVDISPATEEAPIGGKHALEVETVNASGEVRRVVIVPGEADQLVIDAAAQRRSRKAAKRLAAASGGAG